MFKARRLVYWTAQWSKQMFLFLKGSLARQPPISRELHIEWLSLNSQLSLCWLVQLWGAYSWFLWSLSCSPMFHQVKWNPPIPWNYEWWRDRGGEVQPEWEESRTWMTKAWNREGCEQRQTLWAVPGNGEKMKGHVIEGGSLRRRN